MSTKVIIIGAGTGGLCLAHGLKSSGIEVGVYERDRSSTDRLQGYRLHISSEGSQALESCLPSYLFQEYLETSAKPNDAVTFLDSQLHRLLTIPITADAANAAREVPVSRITLRKILLADLDDIVHFDKKFVRFEDLADGRVMAYFEDGTTAEGDVLVGADGASSSVRRQLLPNAGRVDTGIISVTGKLPLTDSVRSVTPSAFFHGPTLVLGPDGRFLFGSAVEYERHGKGTPNLSDDMPDGEPGISADRDEYVMWGFSAHRQAFGNADGIEQASPQELKTLVSGLARDWHPRLRTLIESAEPGTMSAFPVKTSVRIDPWPTRNVTLLGDSLHNMPPYRGMGANMALQDAAALHRLLVSVNRDEIGLPEALSQYERDMIGRGFAAVEASNSQMRQLHERSGIGRTFRNLFFRVVDILPLSLKRAILNHR